MLRVHANSDTNSECILDTQPQGFVGELKTEDAEEEEEEEIPLIFLLLLQVRPAVDRY